MGMYFWRGLFLYMQSGNKAAQGHFLACEAVGHELLGSSTGTSAAGILERSMRCCLRGCHELKRYRAT